MPLFGSEQAGHTDESSRTVRLCSLYQQCAKISYNAQKISYSVASQPRRRFPQACTKAMGAGVATQTTITWNNHIVLNHIVLDGSPGVLLPGYPPGPVYQSRGETAPLATIANRKVTSCRRLSDPTL
jgi:hypothetical protein